MINEPRQSADATQERTTTLSRILIADDDAFTRQLLETLIGRTNVLCAVVMAENGQHALHIYQQEGADLIITDNHMPVMDGVAFIRAIRQEQHHIPIIMLSGSPDVRREAYAAGVTVFLEKPVNIHHLAHTIAEFLPHAPG